jgi:hypothetical protein
MATRILGLDLSVRPARAVSKAIGSRDSHADDRDRDRAGRPAARARILHDGPDKGVGRCRPVWTPAQRILFRFAFVYLIRYTLPFPLDRIPYGGMVGEWTTNACNDLVPRVGRRLFSRYQKTARGFCRVPKLAFIHRYLRLARDC